MMEPAERPTGPVKPGPPEGGRDTDTMLVVDDSPVDRHLAGAPVEKIAGWKAAYAGNGSEALAAIESGPPAAVLTDLMMPGMSGLQLVEAIRERYPLVPVIVMTAHGSEDVAIQALQRGAASYVAKRSLARDLAGTLRQIQSAMRSDREHRRVLGHLTCLRSQFALENDPSIVPALVAYIQQDLVHLGHCDENEAMRLGIALGEALLNALYHGNLEISSALREEDDSAYYQLGEERRQMPPFRERRIHVDAECRRQESDLRRPRRGPRVRPLDAPRSGLQVQHRDGERAGHLAHQDIHGRRDLQPRRDANHHDQAAQGHAPSGGRPTRHSSPHHHPRPHRLARAASRRGRPAMGPESDVPSSRWSWWARGARRSGMDSIVLGHQDDQRVAPDAVGMEWRHDGPSSGPRASSVAGMAVSTAHRQGRPDGDSGTRKASGSCQAFMAM